MYMSEVDEGVNKIMKGWKDEWMNEWKDELMNEWICLK